MNLSPYWYWINERHAIYLRKTLIEYAARGEDAPLEIQERFALAPRIEGVMSLDRLTADPILHEWRFCNVFRELDRVTVWVRKNIRERHPGHQALWYMLAAARTINWPDTLEYLMDFETNPGAWPFHHDFSPEKMGDALDRYKALGKKVYTGAYMIRAESNKNAEWYSWTKQQYVAQIVLGNLWKERDAWEGLLDPASGQSTLEEAWDCLKQYMGWGPFMSFQTVLEWRHTRYLRNSPDASNWAAIGPGSLRGLNRLAERPVGQPIKQAQAVDEMRALLALSRTELGPWVPPLELEDIQNSLCETDKYLRVKNHQGEPRSRYIPGRGH